MLTATLGLALLLALGPTPQFFEVNAVELDVRLEPSDGRLAAKASLHLRSRRVRPAETLALVLPAPFQNRARIRAVWDETGVLAWHTEMAEAALLIRVTFARPLPALARRTVVVSFELDCGGLDSSAPAQLTARAARLESTGWYPLPAGSVSDRLRRVRLAVRLSRSWRVERRLRMKRVRSGKHVAEYELTAENVARDTLLFRAHAQ